VALTLAGIGLAFVFGQSFRWREASYEFDILIAADNARPRPLKVKFAYDPDSEDLTFDEIAKARVPWWAWWRRLRRWREARQNAATTP
jgi:hypothetical protein